MSRLVLTSLFSSEYVFQATVMIESFRRHHSDVTVRVLALDLDTKKFLLSHFNESVEVVCLPENADLLSIFTFYLEDRSLSEAIFTLKVFWIDYLISSLSQETLILYADADLYFLRETSCIEEDTWSVLLSPHFFPKHRFNLNTNGYYNAGFIGIRVGQESKKVVSWWRDRVIEYCGVSKAQGLYADQKYLEVFPSLVRSARAFHSAGTNVGMWQISLSRRLVKRGKNFIIGPDFIESFHFHGLRISKFFIRKGIIRYGLPVGSLYSTYRLYHLYCGELAKVIEAHPNIDFEIYSHNLSFSKELSTKFKRVWSILDLGFLPFGINP